MAKFLLSSNPEALRAAQPHVTVEAEYGDEVVLGSVLTMAHHGPRKGQKCPCAYTVEDIPEVSGEVVVGLSHFDLDTLGGCMAVMGVKPAAPEFWRAAEYVDLNGAHKLRVSSAFSAETKRLIDAWWAWNSNNKLFPARDGSVSDVTEHVRRAVGVLTRILCQQDPELLAAGDKFRADEEALNKRSLVELRGGVAVRRADTFTNHLYNGPSPEEGPSVDEVGRTLVAEARAVVAYNTSFGSITVSFADDDSRGNATAREIVQALFGELAGGHDNIAGSPRGETMTEAQFQATVEATIESLWRCPECGNSGYATGVGGDSGYEGPCHSPDN